MVLHTPAPEPRTTLQKHLDYFDSDHDDIFSPYDTYLGFRDLAYPICYWTQPKFNPTGEKLDPIIFIITLPKRIWSYVPDPLLRFHLNNINATIHGSDTQTYNTQGGFESTKFEEIFELYSSAPGKDYITTSDTFRMWRSQQRLLDFFGPIANGLEWIALWYTVWPESGVITKDQLRASYDGSILYQLAEQRTGSGEVKKSK
ncbi:Caleosin-domain-containing protein [Clavulina sp. PMI_390]|nr:Caleosin-domain-containing protein [Clavulina sp. PMI_390]